MFMTACTVWKEILEEKKKALKGWLEEEDLECSRRTVKNAGETVIIHAKGVF